MDGEAESSFSFRIRPCMAVAVDGTIVRAASASTASSVNAEGKKEGDKEKGVEEGYLPQVLCLSRPFFDGTPCKNVSQGIHTGSRIQQAGGHSNDDVR